MSHTLSLPHICVLSISYMYMYVMLYFLSHFFLIYLIKASKAVAASEATNQKPQRTFLRKGQGLARFKGKSTSNKTVGQPQESVSQFSVVLQKEGKKARNAMPSQPQGSSKLNVPSGFPVAQAKVSYKPIVQGPVVQKPVNANLGLNVNQGFCFSF